MTRSRIGELSIVERQQVVDGGRPSTVETPDRPTPPPSAWPLITLCLAFFMIMVDATVITTALPAIGDGFGASVSGLQWVVDGYTLTFACLLLSGGSLGDRLGSRRVFLVGLAVFTAASVLCGVAPTLGVLNGSRAVQGVGAALALPTSLALIHASYPDAAARARAIGVWGGLGGVAAGLGPVLGGVLTNWVGWRSIFFVNLPIGVAAVALTLRHVVAPRPKRGVGLDRAGQLLAVAAVAGLIYGLIEGGDRGWGSAGVVASFVVAACGAAGFVAVERRQADPMLPLELFRSREFTGAIIVGAAINVGFYGELFLLSLYFQHVRNLSPMLAGLALLPQPGIASVASFLGGRHTARIGPRPVMLVGLVTGGVGLLTMITLTATVSYAVLVLPLLAIGFGTAYTMPAATTATIEAAPDQRAGVASGALNSSRQVGSSLGVAVFGTLLAGGAGFLPAYHMSVVIGGAVFLGAALVALLVVPSRRDVH